MQVPRKIPFSQRVNLRVIGFVAVLALLIGYPTYRYVDFAASQGIKDRGDYKEVDLKWMSSFPFDQINGTINDIPQQFRALDAQPVLLIGEMYIPSNAQPRVNDFELVYSISKCCMVGQPLIQHFVQARLKHGQVNYYPNLVKVKGILHVNVIPGDQKVASVYQLDVQSVDKY